MHIYLTILIFLFSCKSNESDNGGVFDYPDDYGSCTAETDVCLSLHENNDNTASALNYSSSANIAGFQFNHSGCVTDANGGDSEENGFSTTTSNSTVIGFSMAGSVVPSGDGTLTILDGEITRDCLLNFVFSNSEGESLISGWGD